MADGSKIIITCQCGQKMKAPAEAKGKKYKCVRCGALLLVGAEPPDEGGKALPDGGGADESPAPQKAERVGELLRQAGLVTGEQVAQALERQKQQGGKTFENLIELGHLDTQTLHSFLSKQPGVATINLASYKVDRDLVDLIPKELALNELVLPIDKLGKLLTVAMACPLDIETIQEIQQTTGLRVKAMLCKLDDIHAAVESLYRHGAGKTGGPITITLDDLPGLGKKTGTAARPPKTVTPEVRNQFAKLIAEGAPRELVEAAENMPPVAEKLLTAANKGAYGAGKVESVGMAVALLGIDGVAAVLGLNGESG
ncbi:MAG: hypothetical protein ACLFTT_15555 [Candidatus Hydrogenedentota bacterium]